MSRVGESDWAWRARSHTTKRWTDECFSFFSSIKWFWFIYFDNLNTCLFELNSVKMHRKVSLRIFSFSDSISDEYRTSACSPQIYPLSFATYVQFIYLVKRWCLCAAEKCLQNIGYTNIICCCLEHAPTTNGRQIGKCRILWLPKKAFIFDITTVWMKWWNEASHNFICNLLVFTKHMCFARATVQCNRFADN